MTMDQLLAALHEGRLSAAIIEAWLRAGEAKYIATLALGLSIVGCCLGVAALAVAIRRPRV